MTPRAESPFARLDTAAESLEQTSVKLEALAALLGAREVTRKPGETGALPALVLTSLQAYGLAQLVEDCTGELHQVVAELRGRVLHSTG